MSSSTFNTTTGEERRTPLTKLSRKYHRRLKRSSAGKVPQQFSPPSPGRNTGLDSAVTPRPEHLSRDQPRNRPRPVSQIGILAGLTGHDSSSEGSSVEVMAPSAAPVLDNVGPSTSRVLGFRPDESQMLAGNLLPAPPPPGISLTSSSSVLGAGGTCGAPLDCAGWKRHESSHVEHAPYLLELTEEEEPIRQVSQSLFALLKLLLTKKRTF